MAIDFEKMRKNKAEEAAKKNKTFDTIRRLKLKVGENRLRIMPPWTEEGEHAGQFASETFTHWNIGEGGYVEEGGRRFSCPVKTPGGPGGPCEVCDLNSSLRGSSEPADVEMGKQIYARRQFTSNVVNLKDPVITEKDISEWEEGHPDAKDPCPFELGDTKVFVWSYPATIYKDLLDIFADGLDITDFDAGHEVVVTKEGAGLSTQYRVRIMPKPSSFAFEGDLTKALVNLDDLIKYAPAGDMQKALNGELQQKGAPALPAKAPPSLPPKKAIKAAPEPVEEEEVTEDVVDEKPECFKDPKVHSATDVQCVGGTDEEGDEYDACPVFDECAAGVAALVAPPSRRKPAPAKAATPAKKSTSAVQDMEAKLKAALK